MKQNLLLIFFVLIYIQIFAQDKKWNVEANYAVVPSEGFGGDDNIIDLGLKYRFVDFNFINIGFGFNAGFYNDNNSYLLVPEGKITGYFYQPKVFSEFTFIGMERLRPSIGVGYSIVNIIASGVNLNNQYPNFTDGGLNFNLSLAYDIIKNLFIQAQYDFVELNKQENSNNIRLGVGLRF